MKKDTKLILIVLAGILAIVLLCIFAVQGTQNKAFTLEEQVNTAQSDIRVQEKRRVDLVYNLADCVIQYDKHEAETLTAIVEGRGSSGDIENVATAITAVSEAYPELKSNENYKELGDVAWYLAVSADAIGYDLETIFQMNIDKLRARYPDGFDAEHSLHRNANDI